MDSLTSKTSLIKTEEFGTYWTRGTIIRRCLFTRNWRKSYLFFTYQKQWIPDFLFSQNLWKRCPIVICVVLFLAWNLFSVLSQRRDELLRSATSIWLYWIFHISFFHHLCDQDKHSARSQGVVDPVSLLKSERYFRQVPATVPFENKLEHKLEV